MIRVRLQCRTIFCLRYLSERYSWFCGTGGVLSTTFLLMVGGGGSDWQCCSFMFPRYHVLLWVALCKFDLVFPNRSPFLLHRSQHACSCLKLYRLECSESVEHWNSAVRSWGTTPAQTYLTATTPSSPTYGIILGSAALLCSLSFPHRLS